MRLGYLCLRTLRGIGLVAFFPVTIPVLLYALFARKQPWKQDSNQSSHYGIS